MDKSVWLPELMTYARHGFIIASPEYRTVGESGFPGCMIDGKAAIRYLKAHAEEYGIDVNRIAVMGESGGGTIASLIGTTGGIDEFEKGDFLQYDSRVNAVIDYYGIVDMNNSPVRVTGRDVPPWILEDFLEIDYSKDDAAKASAINYVTENTPPFLIFHGSEDQAVPTVQSERLYEKLQEKGVESDLYILDGAMHGEDAFYQNEIAEIVENWLRKVM